MLLKKLEQKKENKMVYTIDKSAILEEAVNGAWDTSMQNRQQALLNKDQALNATSYVS